MPQTSNSYYHLLAKWLLGATNGNQEQEMVDLQSSKIVLHSQWLQHFMICPKLQTPYQHTLIMELLGQPLVTKGNQ